MALGRLVVIALVRLPRGQAGAGRRRLGNDLRDQRPLARLRVGDRGADVGDDRAPDAVEVLPIAMAFLPELDDAEPKEIVDELRVRPPFKVVAPLALSVLKAPVVCE